MIVEKQIDMLTKERFEFSVIDNVIIFNSYELFSRENKNKRSYNSIKHYNRFFRRDSNITLQEVPLTEELKTEVLQEYIKTLKVMTWEEYKR